MSTPEPRPDNFPARVGLVVTASLAIGSFAVIGAAVVMGTADSIPSYFVGFAGIAIGIFVTGAAAILKK